MRVEGLPPLFSGPDALEPGPLWVGGRRRPVPNRWDFNPFNPRLEPAQPPADGHPINRAAAAFLTDPDNFRRCRKLKEFLRRKRTGSVGAPVRRRLGRYEADALEVRKREMRADAAEGVFRLLAWAVSVADWRSGRIGTWTRAGMRYESRAVIAERAGFPCRVDERGRVRCHRLDDRIEDLIAAGLVWRHEEKRKARVAFKLTPFAWILCGVQRLRESLGQRERKKAAKAERDERRRRADPGAAQLVAGLAAARANDTDYTAQSGREGARARGWDPPDE